MTENNYIMYLVKSYATSSVLNDGKHVSNFRHIGINARRCGTSHWPVSVRPSVCRSVSCIVSKWLKMSSCFFSRPDSPIVLVVCAYLALQNFKETPRLQR